MRKINYYRMLLGGISLLGLANVVQAQCVTPPTCAQLGYTKTASECSGHTFLKCPFDTSVGYCDLGTSSTPVVNVCGTPEVGDILYSDMSCTSVSNIDKNKKAIGVIFDPINRLALALTSQDNYWSYGNFDTTLPNIGDTSNAYNDYYGKSNTKTIIEYCKTNNKSCPAAIYANNYTTQGTSAGDWFLPSMGQLKTIYDKKSILNETLSVLGGNLSDNYYWSSTEHSDSEAWVLNFGNGGAYYYGKKSSYKYYIQPILAF